MDITKVFLEHFKFGWVWEVDQILKESREWNRTVVSRSNAAQLARTMMGTQQLVLELESCAKESFLKSVQIDIEEIKFHENVWGKENGKAIHIMLEKFNKASADTISIPEIEEFIHLTPAKFHENLQQGLQAIKMLSVIMLIPSMFQIADILAHFPKLHNLVHYVDTRNPRKPQGMLLCNNDIPGVYYGRSIKLTKKNKDPPTTLQEFHSSIVDARISLTRKLDSTCNKRALLLKMSSYALQEKLIKAKKSPKKEKAKDQGKRPTKKQKVR